MATTKRRRRRRSRGRRKAAPMLAVFVLIVLILAGVMFAFLYEKYSPSKERMSWNTYFEVTASDEAAVILNDQMMDFKARVIDGEPYVTTDTLYDYLNSRFYWDSQENLLLYTTPTELITASAAELGFDNLSSVSTDDEAGAQAAVAHLLKLGHRNIGILGGYMEKSHAAHTRYKGCEKAFAEQGMKLEPGRQYRSAFFSMEEGYHAMEQLFEQMPDLTAVFAMADVLAVGAIRAIRDRGLRVPEDVSVMGFDGIELGNYLSPRLTTVRQARERIADRSLEILLSDIAGERPAVHELLPFDIVEGESAAKIAR